MDISKHAKERYAERIMGYDAKTDISQFVSEHDEKIQKDINKMIQYGKMIYSGKSIKDEKSNVDIYVKDTWVILVDKDKNLVITLYKVDLKVDEEFTKEYVNKILSLIENEKDKLIEVEKEINDKIHEYRALIDTNEDSIKEYKHTIKSLEEQNDCYRKLISNITVDKKIQEDNLINAIKILTGNKKW